MLSLESVVWSICLVRCMINSRWTSWNVGCGIRCTQRMQYWCCLWQCAWLWMLSFQSTKKDATKTAGLVRWSQICWQHLEWRGFVWLCAMLIHLGGHAGFFECCLQDGCKEYLIPRVFLVSRIIEACSARFPVNGFGTSIVYVLAGHAGVYVGKARLDRKRMCGMCPRALEHLRALLYTNVRDGMKPRYRILRRSLGSVFMLPAMWCDSEVRALAVEAVLIKVESPLCNVVDGFGSIVGKRCKVKGRRKRPSSWLRRSKSPFTSIWSHQSVVRLCTPVVGIEVPWSSWSCVAFQASVHVANP